MAYTPSTQLVPGTSDPIELRSTDGRTVRVEFGPYSFDTVRGQDLIKALQDALRDATSARDIHERHINLQSSCPLCVYEANGQLDRLEWPVDHEEGE